MNIEQPKELSPEQLEVFKTTRSQAAAERSSAARFEGLSLHATILPNTIDGGVYSPKFTISGFKKSIQRLKEQAFDIID